MTKKTHRYIVVAIEPSKPKPAILRMLRLDEHGIYRQPCGGGVRIVRKPLGRE